MKAGVIVAFLSILALLFSFNISDEGTSEFMFFLNDSPENILPDSLRRKSIKIGDGKTQVVVFSDYKCKYCHKLLEEFEKAGYSYELRHFPLSEFTRNQALAVECVINQGIEPEEAHKAQINNQTKDPLYPFIDQDKVDLEILGECVSSSKVLNKLSVDAQATQYLGVNSTPSWLVGSRLVIGYRPLSRIKEIIQ